MIEIKKIDRFSLANIASLIYAIFGFLAPLLVYVSSMIVALIKGGIGAPTVKFIFVGLGAGLWSSLLSAVIAGIIGWVAGFLAAWLYNIFVNRFGGIKVELKEAEIKSEPLKDNSQNIQ